MRRLLLTAAGVTLASAAALAESNIPKRYSGSFPSGEVREPIAGTFTGKRLTLRFGCAGSKRLPTTTGSQFCPAM